MHTVRFLPLLILILSLPLSSFGQSPDSLLQGSFWRFQGHSIVLSEWTDHAGTESGGFYAELDREWTPTDSTTQYPGMLARHVFSYSAAYLMDGEERYLRRADRALNFLIEHGWDEQYGGWYNAVSQTGRVVDPKKDLFMQIYATTGLALYWIATRDARAKTYLDRSREFMDEHAWDHENGGYVNVLNRDGTIESDQKRFSPQLAPVSGYLLYLYSATRDTTYLRRAETLMDLALTDMQDERGWILERFTADWTFLPDHSGNSHINVGHNLEVAWLLLRLYAITGTTAYRDTGLALTDKLLDQAFHPSGAWRSKLRRTNPSEYRSTTTWWVQAYGNMLQLYAYRVTGKKRYLNAFRDGARFWNAHFVDPKHGATVLRADLDGGVADGAKAVRTKTSYHALEHALINSLYLSLWVNDTPATLHYRFQGPPEDPFHPLPIEVMNPVVEAVTIDGREQTPPFSSPIPLEDEGPEPSSVRVTVTDTSRTEP